MDRLILAEARGAVHVLTLNRPDRLNAFDDAMNAELMRHLDAAADAAACRAVVLTGAGRGFCAGQSLEGISVGVDLGDALDRTWNPLVRRLRSMPKPVVCAVNGAAAGAGVSVALACDIVLAARSAKFTLAFVRIGLVPDGGASWFLPRLVGEARARGLAILGDSITAEQAEAWGMIWRVTDDATLMSEAMAMATHLSAQPTQAIAMIKRGLDAGADNSLEAQLEAERDLQRAAGATPDFAEGVRAFLEKRKPAFTGRPA